VIREEAHGRKVQTVGHPLDDLPCYFVKSRCTARFIRQYNAEEYGPIATPILTDIVPDVHNIGRQNLTTSETAALISGCLAMAEGDIPSQRRGWRTADAAQPSLLPYNPIPRQQR
jgi:hypothetical protein